MIRKRRSFLRSEFRKLLVREISVLLTKSNKNVKVWVVENKLVMVRGIMYNNKNMEYSKEKFKNAVLFIAENGGINMGKKKLAKLLYFVDFTLYEIRKESLTGMSYSKQSFGPMPRPDLFYNALDFLKDEDLISIEESELGNIVLEEIISKEEPNMKLFDKKEKEIMRQMTKKYYYDTGGELEEKTQDEPPYKMVKHGEKIPYHLAFYRNSFGEMNLDA